MSHHPASRPSGSSSAKRKEDWTRGVGGEDNDDDTDSSDEELLAETRTEPARHDKHRRNLPISSKATVAAPAAPASPKAATTNSNNKRSTPPTASASATPTKRKPYRRTKRPKNYNDKSTITTCTPTVAKEKPNVYDAVLGEAEDLLRAATDNQSLGRLKMASNYLLLLHARLVGLGKKFDRSQTAPLTASHRKNSNGDMEEEPLPLKLKPTKLDLSPERNRRNSKEDEEEEDDNDQQHQAHEDDTESEDGRRYEDADEEAGSAAEDNHNNHTVPAAVAVPKTPPKQKPHVPPSNGISEAALNQLTNYLPSNIEMDQAMVEHLARAAAELHQKRTGKKFSEEGLLNSPAMNTEEVFHYNKEPYDGQFHQYPYNPAPPTAAHSKRKGKMVAAETSAASTSAITTIAAPTNFYTAKNTAPQVASSTVAWTMDEKERFQAASRCTSDPARIAAIMGTRNEAQVRAFLNNAAEMEKGVAAMEKEMLLDDTPRKRGGRGRKPPTTAMNTVPNANVDAKSMLSGFSVGML